MTDLLSTLPDFPIKSYTHLIPSLEKNLISTTDLLTLDALEIAKRAQLPILDLRKLANHVTEALHEDLGFQDVGSDSSGNPAVRSSDQIDQAKRCKSSGREITGQWQTISTLDDAFDNALGGGVPVGYVTEITGESGAGKTQLLLTLLLSAQLPPPRGLGRSTIYISTEAALSTTRLNQILCASANLSHISASDRPTLAKVRAIPVQDLEAQSHILEYQLPTAIKRFDVGLVILDSVAANYRAEHGSTEARELSYRSTQLTRLGHLLQTIAVRYNIAVVVANQVSDRFEPNSATQLIRSSSPALPSSPVPTSSNIAPSQDDIPTPDTVMSLDHQQRFFTGWGDESVPVAAGLKTPALGLTWTNQLACRIALRMEAAKCDDPVTDGEYLGGNIWRDRRKRRFFKVVFAPWTAGARSEVEYVEYEIREGGLVSLG